MRQLYQQQLYVSQQQQQQQPLNQNGTHQQQQQQQQIDEHAVLNEGLNALQISGQEISSQGGKESVVGVSPTEKSEGDLESEEGDEEEDEESGNKKSTLAAASMWTRKDINEFKESVKAEGGEAVIRIGQGESVTVSFESLVDVNGSTVLVMRVFFYSQRICFQQVRVPTHPEGSCLFWEFATDSYDVGFGLFFEWSDASSTETEEVSVHVTEESSEDEEDDEEAFQQLEKDLASDVERGGSGGSSSGSVVKEGALLPKGARPNTDIIIPVYRRDAQNEVYVGSHLFPGRGVYLLKFDNSYSFWRSKTLYYRVYYTK
jgi:hypothetical protein